MSLPSPGRAALLLIALLCGTPVSATAEQRELVQLPEPMRQHMLANMRDHLRALAEIQQALAESRFEAAAEIAESRLGMSSMPSHGASHMARFMPEPMRGHGSAMHQAASAFALTAQEAAVSGDIAKALDALTEVSRKCLACHDAYRVH